MKLKTQKRIAASVFKASPKRVKFSPEALDKIKESITKSDIRVAIKRGEITLEQKTGVSRARANKTLAQKRKGRKSGQGSRKGGKKARNPKKTVWMNKVRKQRVLLKELRDKKLITTKSYRTLYSKVKGGYFRNRAHLKIYINEQGLIKKNGNK